MEFGDPSLLDLHWSHGEKKVARAAFDVALARECATIRKQVEAMLQHSEEPEQVWRIQEFLFEKRDECNRKYDFRYSMLIGVFGRLLSQGWITESDLAGLKPHKLEFIKTIATMHRQRDAQPVVARRPRKRASPPRAGR